MRIWFKLPRPGTETIINRTCPSCGFNRMHIHQHEWARQIVDWRSDTIHQVRAERPRYREKSNDPWDGT